MAEIVLFGDAEAAVVAGLKPRLTPVRVATEVPAQRPTELVKVSLTGGYQPNDVTTNSQITLEAWAGTTGRASQIVREALAHLGSFEGTTVAGVFIRTVRVVGGPVSFPDPATALPRYQATAELSCRYVSVGAP